MQAYSVAKFPISAIKRPRLPIKYINSLTSNKPKPLFKNAILSIVLAF